MFPLPAALNYTPDPDCEYLLNAILLYMSTRDKYLTKINNNMHPVQAVYAEKIFTLLQADSNARAKR